MKHFLLLFISITLLLSGCKPKVPDKYIQEGKMRRILYDYIIADEMARRTSSDTLLMLTYKSAIMKRHGVTVEQFDSSMVYYTRHTRLLYDIYNKISKQLEEEAIAQGASMSDISKYGQITSAADTASIWPGERSFVLKPSITMNTRSFEWQSDTSYHKGDKLMLDFDTQFITPEGQREGIAVISVKFNGDSTSTISRSLNASAHVSMLVNDVHRVGIKSVRCLFMMPQSERQNRVQLLVVSNIKVVKMHTADPAEVKNEDVNRPDSMRTDTTRHPAIEPNTTMPMPRSEAPLTMPQREMIHRQSSAEPVQTRSSGK